MTSTGRRRRAFGRPRSGRNILIWRGRKSVDHANGGGVMVHGPEHGPMVADPLEDGPISGMPSTRDERLPVGLGPPTDRLEIRVKTRPCEARPEQLALETQTRGAPGRARGSGANSVPRRTVVRGERASRSIVNRTTALWSIWVVSSLILAGTGSDRYLQKRGAAKSPNRRGSNGAHLKYLDRASDPAWMDSTTNKRKETNINSGVV